MAEADKPNGPADAAEPPWKVAPGMPIINSSIEGEPDRLYGEVNRSWQPAAMPSLPNSAPHWLPSRVTIKLLRPLRTSADHVLILACGAQQPADTSATQIGTPSRCHSPSNL